MQAVKKSNYIAHHKRAGSRSSGGIETIFCLFCGLLFSNYRSRKSKYCSVYCYREHKKEQREIVVCRQCKIEFESFVKRHRIFCSAVCQNTYYMSGHAPREQNKSILINCKTCGKEYRDYPGSKFCSKKCYANFTKVETICEVCGKIFIHRPAWKARFCSNACVGIYNHNRAGTVIRKRKDNIFSNELKFLVKSFYGNVCFICHLNNSNSKSCSCHHVDYDKKNNSFFNLVPLCQRCHEKTNHNRSYWQQILKALIIMRSMNMLKDKSGLLLLAHEG